MAMHGVQSSFNLKFDSLHDEMLIIKGIGIVFS